MRELILALMMLSAQQNKVEARMNKKVEDTKNYFWLTDQNGVIDPQLILNAKLEQNVRIYCTDGSKFDGVLESVKIEENVYKVFGTLTNRTNAAFGFAITKDGNFAGSIILQDEETLYIVEYSETHKGLVVKRASEPKENNRNKITIK